MDGAGAQQALSAAATAVDVVARLVTPQNLGMSAALWLLLEVTRALLPRLFQSGRFKRLLPLLPEIVGGAAYWIVPTLAAPGATVGERLLTGIVVGTGSSKIHALIKQSILGKDQSIVDSKAKKDKADDAAAKAPDGGGKPEGEAKP